MAQSGRPEKIYRGKRGKEEGRERSLKYLVMEIRKEMEKARQRATKARSCRTDRLSPGKGRGRCKQKGLGV